MLGWILREEAHLTRCCVVKPTGVCGVYVSETRQRDSYDLCARLVKHTRSASCAVFGVFFRGVRCFFRVPKLRLSLCVETRDYGFSVAPAWEKWRERFTRDGWAVGCGLGWVPELVHTTHILIHAAGIPMTAVTPCPWLCSVHTPGAQGVIKQLTGEAGRYLSRKVVSVNKNCCYVVRICPLRCCWLLINN